MADDDVPFRSLYRRFRPQRFGGVRGQEHVVRALTNAVREGRVGHAYLFSGPRGTGKTSTARILAKALNCEALENGEPCGRCPSCVAVEQGSSLDVHELDAASNNGVEAMRDLVARAALGTPGHRKVYIVDEVHMLSTAASNALLKTLEEPPGHVVFVLATTDPQKVLPTIRSRTQHFEFRLLGADVLGSLLREVNTAAGLGVAPEAIDLVARRGKGSARDALSVLDQVAAAGEVEDEATTTDEIVEALCERDGGRSLVAVAQAVAAGRDPRRLAGDLVDHIRNAFLLTQAPALVALPDDARHHVAEQARRLGPAFLVRAIEVLGQAQIDMREALDPQITLDAALVRLARPEADSSPAALLERIERLERAAAAAAHAAPPASTAPRGAHAGAAPPAAHAAPPAGGPRAAPPASAAPPVESGHSAAPTPPSADPPPSRTASGAPAPPPPSGTGPGAPQPPSRTGPRTPAPPPPAAARPAPPPVPGRRPPPPPPPPPAARPEGPAPFRPPSDAGPSPAIGSMPTRDALTKAWGDVVLASLSGRAKARFGAGRFVAVEDGAAVFALPNAHYLGRCEEVRSEVETALATHFAAPVPLRLVVEPPGSGPEHAAAGEPPPADDDSAADFVDGDDGRHGDAPAVTSPEEQLKRAFPGAEEVAR